MDILIVEDDYISRVILKKYLKTDGHQVLEAVDGKEALQIYQEHDPDMIITDWMMPEMDGITLCRKIRETFRRKYAYIVMLTSKDEIKDLVEVFEAGADDYISKPVRAQELKSRIKTGHRVVKLEKTYHSIQAKLVKKNMELDQALADLKITQSQMLQSEKMASIGQLSAGVAHEINNPIGFITGNLDTLQGYFKDMEAVLSQYQSLLDLLEPWDRQPEAVRHQIQNILGTQKDLDMAYITEDIPELLKDCIEGTQRIAGIVRDLKNFARPGNPGLAMMDINSGLKSTLNVIHSEIKFKAEVVTDLGQIDPVEGNPQELSQVFMNLLLNAGQAIEKKGTITVQTRQDDTHVLVRISDTGCGIPSDQLSRIFDPFYTTKPIGQGTGLGLSSAYDIVKGHKGRIDVESEEGKGSCFTVSLPISKGYKHDRIQ